MSNKIQYRRVGDYLIPNLIFLWVCSGRGREQRPKTQIKIWLTNFLTDQLTYIKKYAIIKTKRIYYNEILFKIYKK